MNINLIKDVNFKAQNQTLDECLIELSRYGEPSLTKMKRGWWARIEVFVTGKGVQFDVNSESDNATPHNAVCQCYDRLIAAIKLIKKT